MEMPDPQQQENNQPPLQDRVENREPAIRTMKSDVAEYLQKSKPSLAQIVGLEAKGGGSVPPQPRKKLYRALGGALAAILVISGAALFIWQRASAPVPAPVDTTPKEPAPLFAVEKSRTIVADTANRPLFLRLMDEALREGGRDGTITRIVLKLRDGPQERFATLNDFFALYRIEPPPNTFRQVEGAVMPFLHHGGGETRLSIAVKTRDTARIFRDLLLWESSLAVDLLPLFSEQNIGPSSAFFEDKTYRNIDWRFLRLVPHATPSVGNGTTTTSSAVLIKDAGFEKDIGIGHTVFPARNVAVITTSKKTMEAVIDRLFDGR